ncbi:hypothetical protein [Streptomyces sp. BPTC-684]|uniref:hypothetical protein n=1 Tax=Streptomyces sp. BPTC-684 TaxID=3043734 RepID=UPI0024B2741B|nr:hypothetical protein [Streptomyces sp. BPTC-684]WHM36299.1 hypothetical protein QIY60_04715 [Streptomyces sp. BPTC-684]
MDTYAHGYGSTGHYAKPGTHVSYCGRELQHTPNTAIAARTCGTCTKAEKRDRIEAEQVAADRATDGPTLAERAGVRYTTVGTGRRIHYSNNDDTLCGREVSEYVSGSDLLALFNKGRELCARCISAAEQRAYDRALAAAGAKVAEQIDDADALLADIRQTAAEADSLAAEVAAWGAEVDAVTSPIAEDAEAQQAAALVTEAEVTAGTWRGEWIGEQPADDALFAVERPTEQGALFDDRATVEESPASIVVRASFRREDLDRIRAKADADRAEYRAEMDARRAAEAARYAPQQVEQAIERHAVEGVIVAHDGRTRGTAPKHSTDPDALAALAALGNLRLAEITDHTDIGAQPGNTDHDPNAWGFLVEPRGNGRVALYWMVAGRYVRTSGKPWAVELEIGADRLRKAGWQIEPLSRRCVFAWRPTE